mgnify:CR=1 FL=1|tara:strand:- start:398 stop:1072 length:675 start_codon:yes stop_codon:yes gene_type:complete
MELKFAVPKSLNDIPLHRYQKLITKENPTDEDSLVCLLDINKENVKHIKQEDFNYMVDISKELFKQETPLVRTFTLDGVSYGFIPKLDDITYGENKDITRYLPDWGQMHKAMAVLYRPINKKIGMKYMIDSYEGSHLHSEALKKMPLSIALGASIFFYALIRDLLNYTQNYLEMQQKDLKTKKIFQTSELDSQPNGDHTQNYILLLKETLQSLKKLQKRDYINA